MEFSLLPGYEEIFGSSPKAYEQYLADTPTHLVLSALAILNAELDIPYSDVKNQNHLFDFISQRFTDGQLGPIKMSYQKFKKAHPDYENDIFAQRYLVAMMIKEFNRNLVIARPDTTPNDEYNIFMAYLLVVDEVNASDAQRNTALSQIPTDGLTLYRWAWTSLINQYEFSDLPHPGMGLFKLASLSKYAKAKLRPFLKQYLNGRGFGELATFLGSYVQLSENATSEFVGSGLKRMNIVEVTPGTDTAHLDDMCINPHLGVRPLELADLKQYPLYQIGTSQYIFLDRVLFLKKVFQGPFFELLYKTDLKTHYNPDPKKNFNPYSSEVSLEVLEKICFQGSVNNIGRTKYDMLYFDDGTDSVPDGYFRNNRTIFIIEFKGAIFPSRLTLSPDFDDIKDYIDSRFIRSDRGKPKGVGQLAAQITLLQDGLYGFDKKFNEWISKGHYTIYPIICHTEYYFSLPGVNDYLGDVFSNLVQPKGKCVVKDLTVIDLTTFFQLALYGHDFNRLQALIDRYHHIVASRKRKFAKGAHPSQLYNTMASFDEIYWTIIRDDVIKTGKQNVKTVTALLDLQTDLDEKL